MLSDASAGLGILPPLSPDPVQVGNIRRTLTLLNTSTPQHRNTVRILFYGQSITLQGWWLQVAQAIQDNYPNANLVIANRAINGHTVDELLSTAEADVYPFQPDLIVFHAFGPEVDHELFQQRIHLRTCADVMWQNDHIASWDGEPGAPVPIESLQPTDDDWHSLVYIPRAAARYGDCQVDVRTPWKAYLRTNHVSLTNLLQDVVHLNPDGSQLMADILRPYLAPQTETDSPDPYNSYGIHTYLVGSDVNWFNGALTLPVWGSRVDVVFGPGKSGQITAELDGQPPSTFPGAWTFTRTSTFGTAGFPSLLKVESDTLLQAEHWQLTVTGVDSGGFTFSLHGSVTGDDGRGTNTAAFRSNSGRVVIQPADWSLQNPAPGFQVSWDAVAQHADTFTAAPPPDSRNESLITVAQNLSDSLHVLLLKASSTDVSAVRAIRVYSPKERFDASYRPPFLQLTATNSNLTQLSWPAWLPGWQLEQSLPDRGGWNWIPVTNSPTPLGQQLLLNTSADWPAAFYHLRFGAE